MKDFNFGSFEVSFSKTHLKIMISKAELCSNYFNELVINQCFLKIHEIVNFAGATFLISAKRYLCQEIYFFCRVQFPITDGSNRFYISFS